MNKLNKKGEMTVMTVNEVGEKKFEELIQQARDDDVPVALSELINSDYMEEFLGGKMKIKPLSIMKTKQNLADHIYSSFANAGESVQDHVTNRGLWMWYMIHFGGIHQLKLKGTKLFHNEKYIPHGDAYRHFMVFLSWVRERMEMNGGHGKIFLSQGKSGVTHFGEFGEQMIQGHIMRSDACWELIDYLYYDDSRATGFKKNSTGHELASIRKLKRYLYKLDTVFDVYSMSFDELLRQVVSDGRFSHFLPTAP